MKRFIGRKDDLNFLKESYDDPKFKAIALIGRRRVGKTCLIEEFIRDKDSFYVQFLDTSVNTNLRYLESCMGQRFDKEYHFRSSIDFFVALKNEISDKRFVIAFDEYPFISTKDESFSSLLQNFIDHDIGNSIVILSGSSVSMMDQEISGNTRPLFGRVHRYTVEPMGISDCIQFHPKMSDEDQMRMYLTFGGIPMYYDSPSADTYAEYMEKYVLKKNSALNLEGEGMIRRELPNSEEYNAILDSLADHSDTVLEMTQTTSLDRSTVRHHLDTLINLGLIETIHPMAGAKTRPERFRIKDRMLAFHYMVLRKSQTFYSSIGYDYDAMKERISTFHGRMFEMQCADYIKEKYRVKEIGMWSGKVAARDRNGNIKKNDSGKPVTEESDIDVVAYIQDGKIFSELYGECKFTGELVGFPEMNALSSRMRYANVGANNQMIFFSRTGYDSKFKEYAKDNNIILVELEDMLSEKR